MAKYVKTEQGYIDMPNFAPAPFKPEGKSYLTFSSSNRFTLAVYDATKHWNGILEYFSADKVWVVWDGTTTLSAVSDDGEYFLYLRGTGNKEITGFTNGQEYKWVLTGSEIACTGNIENLLDYGIVESGGHPTMASYCYRNMFYGCTALTQAPALPAKTLADYCYSSMFYGCTALTQAPALPATTLADYCYEWMFSGCTSLTKAPALPAKTLAISCYHTMFYGCTSLTQAPELPATSLVTQCYDQMFYGCRSIKLSSTQTGEYTQEYIVGYTSNYAYLMFYGTGGTFTGTPDKDTYYLSTDNMIVRDTEIATLNGYVGSMIDNSVSNPLNITGATVGQIAKITAVDESGKPTSWEAVDDRLPKVSVSDAGNVLGVEQIGEHEYGYALTHMPTLNDFIPLGITNASPGQFAKVSFVDDFGGPTAWEAADIYEKPDTGIPKTDLEQNVQTSLDKADTAISYDSQTMTEAQQKQARTNIGALDVNVGTTPVDTNRTFFGVGKNIVYVKNGWLKPCPADADNELAANYANAVLGFGFINLDISVVKGEAKSAFSLYQQGLISDKGTILKNPLDVAQYITWTVGITNNKTYIDYRHVEHNGFYEYCRYFEDDTYSDLRASYSLSNHMSDSEPRGSVSQFRMSATPTEDMHIATKQYVDTAKTEAQQLGLTTATPGQIIKVKTVQDGKPTEWEAVDMPSGSDEWELIAHINVADDVEKDVTVWEYNNLPRYKYIAYKKVNLVGSGDQTASGCTIQINNESSQPSGMTYGKSGSPQNCIGMIYVMPFGWTHYKTVDAISPNNISLGGFNAMLTALPLSDNAITSIKLSAHTTYKIASGEIWLYGKKG